MAIDIARLAGYPLLLPDTGYSIRRFFNAACRLAHVDPNILLESRAPHTLLALAEAGQGVAVIPSLLRTDLPALRPAGDAPAPAAARAVCHSVGTSGA